MKKRCMTKIFAGVMVAVLTVSMPVAAAEETVSVSSAEIVTEVVPDESSVVTPADDVRAAEETGAEVSDSSALVPDENGVEAENEPKVEVPESEEVQTTDEIKDPAEDPVAITGDVDENDTLTMPDNDDLASMFVDGGEGTDETEEDSGMVDIGDGSTAYIGAADPIDIAECRIDADDKVYAKKKGNYKSSFTIYNAETGKKLKAGKDYKTKYKYELVTDGDEGEKLKASSKVPSDSVVRITITGKGKYTGTISAEYRIYNKKKGIDKLFITVDNQKYNGETIVPELSNESGEGGIHVFATKADKNKVQNELNASDYVEIISCSKNKKVGTASIKLRAKGDYAGQKNYSFKIQKKVGVEKVFLDETSLSLKEGETHQFVVTTFPKNADDYTMKWSASSKAVSVDENGLVQVTGKGMVTVTLTLTDANKKKIKKTCTIFANVDVITVSANTNDKKDDTAAFNAAIRQARDRNVASGQTEAIVYVPAGTYYVDVNDPYKKIEITGSKAGKVSNCNVSIIMDDKAVLQALPTNKTDYYMIWIANAKNVSIKGGTIIGDKEKHTSNGQEGNGHCIGVIDSQNVKIEGMDISNAWGDGIYVGTFNANTLKTKDVTINNCKIHNNGRNNVALTSGKSLTMKNCGLWGHGTNEGLCIETNNDSIPVENVTISDCSISDNGGKEAAGIPRSALNVTFKNTTINGDFYNGGGGNVLVKKCTITGRVIDKPWAGATCYSPVKFEDTVIGVK